MRIPNQHQSIRIGYITSLFADPSLSLFERKKYPAVVNIQHSRSNKIKATLPLKDHSFYGETVLYISEKLNEDGVITEYHYAWEYSQREKKKGIQVRHIIAFGNEDHSLGTHAWVNSNPFHHHHVPGEPKQRKATSVQNLETMIQILETYIGQGRQYCSSHTF